MTPVLAALLLTAAGLAEEPAAPTMPAPAAATPAPDTPATPAPGTAAASVDAETSGSPVRPAARILPLDLRMEAYTQFRQLYETSRYSEALPLAQRVVELSEAVANNSHELPIAYNNLGATHYQLGEYAAAEAAYKQSLDVLEATQGISSRRLIVPLSGLGAAYAAQDQHAKAVEMFERAIAVSRRSEGLFNQNQLPLLEESADSRFALNDLYGVEQDRYYALRIAEQNYGFGDPHTLAPSVKLANFYERAQQFGAARVMWMRVRDILARDMGGFNPLLVRALVGICRSHRLQYTHDPDTLDDDAPSRDPITGELMGHVYRSALVPAQQADRAGLKSAEEALEMLRAQPDPPPELMTETLIELGDWFQATSRPVSSMPYYEQAANVFAQNPDPQLVNPLLEPRMVFYRAPLASKRAVGTADGDIRIRSTVFDFVVSEKGDTQDINVVSTDMLDGQLAQSRRALSRAIYSPRFEDGRAVATRGVRFTSDWYEEAGAAPAEAAPAAAPAAKPEGSPASAPGS